LARIHPAAELTNGLEDVCMAGDGCGDNLYCTILETFQGDNIRENSQEI
jgi:hypothetical protein